MRFVSALALVLTAVILSTLGPAAAQYRDDFEDEREGELPSHWMESEAEERWDAAPRHWRVRRSARATDGAGDQVYFAQEYDGERKALLHTFGSNVQVGLDFRVTRHRDDPQARLSFLLRANSDKDRIELTYDFAARLWEARERTGIVEKNAADKLANNPSRLLATTAAALPQGWNRLEIRLVQTTLIAVLNGQELMTAIKLEHLSYGRVGFEVRYADVMLDNFEYLGDGEGRVHDGIKELGGMHDEIYSDIFKTPQGVITLKSHQRGRWGVLQTRDAGESWQFTPGGRLASRDLNQVLLLDSGQLLDISAKQAKPGAWWYESSLSADGGASWATRVRLPREASPVYMEPGRIQRAETGRIFFTIDNARREGSRLYYSDDGGEHWRAGAEFTPATYPKVFRKIKRFEAPHVVSCGGSRLAMFFRTNRDYHYRTTSEDNGMSWSDPLPAFALRSSLSDASFGFDPDDNAIYAVWLYELRGDPPGCRSEGQWPRERVVLTRSSDCGATWSYLMDLENWEGNDARFNQLVLRIFGDYIWVSLDAHVAAAPNSCGGASYLPAVDPRKHYDWRRLYRVDKRKLMPLPRMPLLLTR